MPFTAIKKTNVNWIPNHNENSLVRNHTGNGGQSIYRECISNIGPLISKRSNLLSVSLGCDPTPWDIKFFLGSLRDKFGPNISIQYSSDQNLSSDSTDYVKCRSKACRSSASVSSPPKTILVSMDTIGQSRLSGIVLWDWRLYQSTMRAHRWSSKFERQTSNKYSLVLACDKLHRPHLHSQVGSVVRGPKSRGA